MRRTAFSLIELLVVITVITLLAALLFPVFVEAKARAKRAACMANLRELGHAIELYRSDNDGRLPETLGRAGGKRGFVSPLRPYASDVVLVCPSTGYEYMSRLSIVSANSYLTDWWEKHGVHELSAVRNWEPGPDFVIVMCNAHLLKGWDGGLYQMMPASGPQGRKGRHVLLRLDGSAGEADAQAVLQYVGAIEAGRPVWRIVPPGTFPPDGGPIVDRFPQEPLLFDLPESKPHRPGAIAP